MSYSNKDKMLQAVLSDKRLMELGKYSYGDFGTIYEALNSDNYVINVVAQIITRVNEDAKELELWKQVNDYLKTRL